MKHILIEVCKYFRPLSAVRMLNILKSEHPRAIMRVSRSLKSEVPGGYVAGFGRQLKDLAGTQAHRGSGQVFGYEVMAIFNGSTVVEIVVHPKATFTGHRMGRIVDAVAREVKGAVR